MKKIILSALFVGGMFTFGAFAQNNNQLEAIAKNALRSNGCLDGRDGQNIVGFRYEVTPLLDNCYSVTAYPIANHTIAPFVKFGPVGTATICDGEVTSVSCN